MISEYDIILRLVIAAVLGAFVGLEREYHKQPAGLRTHTILAIGSALAMCVSIRLAMDFRTAAPNGDPARLAAQVISGIGFLGAGAILRYGTSIKGLTTATSLWTVAIIGLAVGAGHHVSAVVATSLIIIVLVILDYAEKRFIQGHSLRTMKLVVADSPGIIHEVERLLSNEGITVKSIGFDKNLEANEIEIDALVKVPENLNPDRIVALLSKLDRARTIEFE